MLCDKEAKTYQKTICSDMNLLKKVTPREKKASLVSQKDKHSFLIQLGP